MQLRTLSGVTRGHGSRVARPKYHTARACNSFSSRCINAGIIFPMSPSVLVLDILNNFYLVVYASDLLFDVLSIYMQQVF